MNGTSIIKEYRKIYEEEAVAESMHDTAKRVYKHNLKSTWPAGVGATDYTVPRVTHSVYIPDTIELEQSRQEYIYSDQDLRDIKAQRKRLECKIENLGDKEKKVAMYKIQGMTNEQVAEKLDISVRHVYRLLHKIN